MIDVILRHQDDRPALVAPGQGVSLTYGELGLRVEELAARLRQLVGERRLVFLAPAPDVEGVLLYLACLRARLPLCLAEPQLQPLARLSDAYHPALVLLPQSLGALPEWDEEKSPVPGYLAFSRGSADPALHPDLALLLTTSGSTGSPKLVRLTARNLGSNARAIAEYLELGPDERAVQSLPIHYSYGLSVLNSHLVAGGSVLLTPHSFMRPEFWSHADQQRATSFAGVPYMYETLHRLRFDPAVHPSLRTMTQAGGALRRDLITHFHARATQAGARLVVMYGQTEATARISYVPPHRLSEKVGAIGVPIPGGRLRLEPLAGAEGPTAELVYEGENVMMGYAETAADLALGDLQRGVLRTGDLGAVDSDGYFTLTGRLKRFAKLFGRRVSLEDVERELESAFPVRAIATDARERLGVHVEVEGAVRDEALVAHLARFLAVPPSAILVRRVSELPLTTTGKKDYKAAEALS
ncbi:MAG: AMP-dependent acyl-CoA synthetase [Geminicoccaceae bacterium]|nr:AMP-dependent acyl-CoA synthetase [Geminicoccaceae bacterium]